MPRWADTVLSRFSVDPSILSATFSIFGALFQILAHPAGLLVYHNTIIGEQVLKESSTNMHFGILVSGEGYAWAWHHDVGKFDRCVQFRLQWFSTQ